MLSFIDRICSKVTSLCGALACLAMLLMLLNVFYDVIMRYLFNDVSIGMQELEWHLFAVVFLLGTPYAMQRDGHVRVDIFYDRWKDDRRAWVNLFGAFLFVFPFAFLVSFYGISFAADSFQMGEGSGDPGGLPHRWIIKALIPLSFSLIAVAGVGMMVKAIMVLKGMTSYSDVDRAKEVLS